jgi:hypothetical protein
MPDLSTSPALLIMPKLKVKVSIVMVVMRMNLFIQPWAACPGCNQYYQNELAIDIANKFVSFVRRQYLDDTPKQVEALYVKLGALNSMFGKLQPVRKIEAGVTADVLLSLIDRMKNDAPLQIRYSEFAAIAYNTHGRIALDEGTEESARRAVIRLENQLEVNESIGDVEGIAMAQANIAVAKSKYEGDSNIEELVKTSRDVYELAVSEYGEGYVQTIRAGKIYALRLRKANRLEEARELLTKLLATSKQTFGSHHNTTKEVELALQEDECDDYDDDDDSDDIEARERVTDPLYESILFVSLLIGMLGMLYDISLAKN